MTDDLNITSGGAIKIDSSVLRDISGRFGGVGRALTDASDLLHRARYALGQVPEIERHADAEAITACGRRLSDLAPEVQRQARGVGEMADTFEVVELRAEQEALGINRPDDAMALQARINDLVQANPQIEKNIVWLTADWEGLRYDGLEGQSWDRFVGVAVGAAAGVLPAFLGNALRGGAALVGQRPVETTLRVAAAASGALDRGVLPFGTTLKGAAPPVQVTLIGAGTASPPTSLKDTVERIPYGREGQIVVEKYTMKDGSNHFMAYVDGTRTVMPGTDEPWDMGSNWDMYIDREKAASEQATLMALEAAGAQPGDHVDLVGYSQGAGIVSFTAMDSPYETDLVVTAGSPTEPSLADDQTLVQLRHEGDPVSNLAAGGAMGGTGAADSFTASRSVDPGSPFAPHMFEAYLETAGQVDGSGDPRAERLQAKLVDELGDAVSVEVMEFKATRP